MKRASPAFKPPKNVRNPRSTGIFYRRLNLRRRPFALPPFWQKITAGTGVSGRRRARNLTLVLDALFVPYYVSDFRGQTHIYAPPTLAAYARREILAYAGEEAPKPPAPKRRYYKCPYLVALFLIGPLLLDFLRNERASLFGLPPPDQWGNLGCVDAFKILVDGQWYRVVTALSLHASLEHLSGNLFFGAIFLAVLARLTGVGHAFLLAVLGGSIGNAVCLIFRGLEYRSLGFSSALFAAIGATAGVLAIESGGVKKALPPVAAALALLALLGSEGETTDYGAHISGICCGALLGAAFAWRLNRHKLVLPSMIAGVAGLALIIGAWALALL